MEAKDTKLKSSVDKVVNSSENVKDFVNKLYSIKYITNIEPLAVSADNDPKTLLYSGNLREYYSKKSLKGLLREDIKEPIAFISKEKNCYKITYALPQLRKKGDKPTTMIYLNLYFDKPRGFLSKLFYPLSVDFVR